MNVIKITCWFLLFANPLLAFDWHTDVNFVEFTSESHPSDANIIRKDTTNKVVSSIQNGSWIYFQNFDFGSGVAYLWLEAAATRAGGQVELRIGSSTGPLIGSVNINRSTGSLSVYKPFSAKTTGAVNGVHDLYLKFVGGGADLFNIRKFRFQRLAPDYRPAERFSDWVKPVVALGLNDAASFNTESNPLDSNTIRKEGREINYIRNGSWVCYNNFDFGAGAKYFEVTPGSWGGGSGGTLEVRLGSATGTLVGTASISAPFSRNEIPLSQTVSGVKDLYFRFVGGGGYLYNIKNFRFSSLPMSGAGSKSFGRNVDARLFDQESHPGIAPVIVENGLVSSLSNGSWVSYSSFDFGINSDLISIDAATAGSGGAVEVRVGSESGPLVATVDVTFTGSSSNFRTYTAALTQRLSGTQNLNFKFIDTYNTSAYLFALKSFAVGSQTPKPTVNDEGTLFVYDAVPGLDPSPYYTYSVQKVDVLNAPLKQNATNWEQPFAWFSECKTGGMPFSNSYYSNEIGGWSHTYCNFELGKNTPIVVKITRKTVTGAPSGPIFMANVHPAHKVISCEIINGDVYVTMKEPALVTVDIDGQMDARDAPRIDPAELASSKPFANKANGSHAVSIFANPVLMDKPVIGAPDVRYINPGDPLPAYNDPTWTTLYFGKGVHQFSRNPDSTPGIWKNGDAYILMSNKICYIPGDAMIYGNFDGNAENSTKERVRMYGYGTINCSQMPHYNDSYWDEPAQAGTIYNDRGISMSTAVSCRFEGITLVDPANHGVANERGYGNVRSWMKQISWRANSDMGGLQGVIENCFLRLQDDGPYVSGDDFRHNTLWMDCNGAQVRGDFIAEGTHDAGDQTVVEDCDYIYMRSNWGGALFGLGNVWRQGTYPDGTKNTAQHVVFRNLRATDPRPSKRLFEIGTDTPPYSLAGIRFENIEYRHPYTWELKKTDKDEIVGSATVQMHHLYFDRVFINGRKMDNAMLADPIAFTTSNISDMIFVPTRVDPSMPPVVTVSASAASASESAANGEFTFARDGNASEALTVNFNVSGTATIDSDYQSIGTSVTFAAGQTSTTKTVTLLDDNLLEDIESVVLTLASGTGYTLGSATSAAVYIMDNDTIVTVSATAANAAEPASNGTFTFTRTGNTSLALTVNFTVGGTATSSLDYQSLGTSVTIEPGQTTAIRTVTVIDDNFVEPVETVVLTLANGTGFSLGSSTRGTVNISDNDASVVTFQQDSTLDGLVILELENPLGTRINSPSGQSWTQVTSPSAFSGSGALQALPNTGTTNNLSALANSPRLDFRVNFTKTGTHYIWLRGVGAGSSDNSVTVGLNGVATTGGENVATPTGSAYGWTNSDSTSTARVINVPSVGMYMLNVWMREDGVVVDKLILTVNSAFTRPTGNGPAESPMSLSFNNWSRGYGLTEYSALATASPAGDGVPNLIKYALGLKPIEVASANPVKFEQIVEDGRAYLKLSVIRDPMASNIKIEGLSAVTMADLSAWSTDNTVVETDTPSAFAVRDSVPIGTGGMRFMRLRFTQQ